MGNALILFVVGFGVAYLATRQRSQAVRVQAGIVLGLILSLTPVVVGLLAR